MIAFAFWGIPRGFSESKESIVKFMKSFNQTYHVYFHTYQINGTYTNPRNGEYNIKINSNVLLELNPIQYKIDDQEYVSKILEFKKYYSHPDPWNTGYNSVNNFILASYSKHLVTQMIETSGNDYKYIIYVRPDCKFSSFYYDGMLNNLNHSTILIPKEPLYSDYHFNDQFAITTNQNYKIYGNLFHSLYNYSKSKSLHSETYISEMLLKNNIQWKYINLNYQIVRVSPKKFKLLFV
jgi:hypothetical protein